MSGLYTNITPIFSGEIKMVTRLEELHECADILNKVSPDFDISIISSKKFNNPFNFSGFYVIFVAIFVNVWRCSNSCNVKLHCVAK